MSSKVKSPAESGGGPALVPRLRFPEFIGHPLRDLQLADATAESTERNGSDQAPSQIMGVSKVEGIVPMEERIVAADTARYKFVRKDWFAYNPMRLNIGSIARWQGDNDILVSPDYVVFKCKGAGPHRLDPAYLDHFRRSDAWEEFVSEKGDGSVRVRIYYKDLARLQLALPSFPEQQKIAECLDSADALIAAQGRKMEALKAHKKGLMQQLLPQEGETQPRLRLPEFQGTGDWELTTLGGVAKISSGTTPLRSNSEYFEGGTIPWVKTTDLNNSMITDTEERVTKLARVRMNPIGSILVAMYGGFNQIGRTGCLGVPAATNQAISVLAVESKALLPVYVLAWLNAKVGQWRRIASSSRKDPNITGSDVASFPICIPKLPEQQRIADCLTSLDDLIAAETRKLDMLKTHKKGLMQQLFPQIGEADA